MSIGQLYTGCVIGCFNSFVNTFFCINRLVNFYHKAKNTVHMEDENSVLMFSCLLLVLMLSVNTVACFFVTVEMFSCLLFTLAAQLRQKMFQA